MTMTAEKRFRKKLKKIGNKNHILKYLVLPALLAGTFCFQGIAYLRHNGMRLVMLAMVPCLCMVYSSFSFPAFAAMAGEDMAEGTALAAEAEWDMREPELPETEGPLPDMEPESGRSHSLYGVDQQNADENPKSAREQGENPAQEEEAPRTDGEGQKEYEFSRDDWRLLLINKEHSIPDDYTFTLGTIEGTNGSMKCDERIMDDLLNMRQAAGEDGIDLVICSPYRDMDRQEMLFNRKITRYMNRGLSYMEAYQLASQLVMVPGASEHQLGLALDIVTGSYVTLDEGFADTDAGKWLAENSCRFGFILRYPEGKEYITGVEYEPWHFRYVGVEAAVVITEKQITLEEFWEDL